MFEQFTQYKRRLTKVREELHAIDDSLSPVVAADDSDHVTTETIKAIALGVCRVCRILVRVIDSLPG